MMRSALRIGGLVLALAALPRVAHAVPITVDFEGLADGTSLIDQIAALTFTNALALTSGAVGGSLNEFDFPPRSGQSVIIDDFGPMTISFSSLVYNLSGYFTYSTQLVLTAYDAAANALGSVSSLFTANLPFDGGTPNEQLQFQSLVGISFITIAGDPVGGSFTLDDFTYDTDPESGGTVPPPQSVPEPTTLVLLLMGGSGLIASRRRA
jgi:hypothetical protein